MLDKDAIKELSKAGAITAADEALAGAIDNGSSGIVALPNDFTMHDMEKSLPQRRRARGCMTTSLLPDFASYTNLHREPGASVFVDQDRMQAVAVLNLGDPTEPGHADNTAKFTARATAAYRALIQHANGQGHKQQVLAEFIEDWAGTVECFNDAGPITGPKAIAAVRKITIESLKKLENTEQQLGASRSAFESIQASSTEPLPTTIYFKCVPYQGLAERLFVLRLGVLTGNDKPTLNLRVVNQEKHAEEMAAELAQLVRDAIGDELPVLVGAYAVAA